MPRSGPWREKCPDGGGAEAVPHARTYRRGVMILKEPTICSQEPGRFKVVYQLYTKFLCMDHLRGYYRPASLHANLTTGRVRTRSRRT